MGSHLHYCDLRSWTMRDLSTPGCKPRAITLLSHSAALRSCVPVAVFFGGCFCLLFFDSLVRWEGVVVPGKLSGYGCVEGVEGWL